MFRGVSTGLYTNSSPEDCHYFLEHSKAQIAVVENDYQMRKILLVMV